MPRKSVLQLLALRTFKNHDARLKASVSLNALYVAVQDGFDPFRSVFRSK